ncbi:ribonuclease, Rne/Rng family [Thermocrinis albus DSM 14484]|uniref:Ribonuclease, Rne/Rng family n=1 Tax=Thermocrinis albus (strain DSM 14484 / JCM 11386 / HI 11/12) TaxID=638303 RepID=D3SLN1_THEAH|nr:Rne/Rng family ribonuclease [Thermocrinis albus]ADC89661.1 ribonuclease, Rne/Rng family [Thermocrinis albus DSM 14484]
MAKKLLILSSDRYVFAFLLEGFDVVKMDMEDRKAPRILGSIFKGKVLRVVKGLEGAFVDIGLGKEAYLPLKDLQVKVGDTLLVQAVREEVGQKGVRLTDKIRIPGKYIVYFPSLGEIRCSSKLDKEGRCRWVSVLSPHLEGEGVIVRTGSVYASEEEVLQELAQLRNLYRELQNRVKRLKKPKMVLEEYPCYKRFIRDHWHELEEIYCDDPVLWNDIASFLDSFHPPLLERSVYVRDPTPLINRYHIRELFRRLFSKYVWLKSGGYIVIEETEAMTVIDVNSGEPCGNSQEESALRTNLEAAKEIAKQVILRNLGGIIIVDFIDMKRPENREAVTKALKEAFGEDGCNVQFYGFTRLGLFEMVRRKTKESFPHLLSSSCPVCGGSGRIKAENLFLFELEKDLKSVVASRMRVRVRPERSKEVEKLLERLGVRSAEVEATEDVDYNDYEVEYEK